MARQVRLFGITLAFGLAGLFFVSSHEMSLAQQAGFQAGGQGGGIGGGGIGGGGFGGAAGAGGFDGQIEGTYPYYSNHAVVPFGAGGPVDKTIEVLRRKLRKAETVEAKEAASKELRAALLTSFEADMTHRKAELDKIKERVKEMEAVLEKRTAAKAEIIDLRLQVLVQEAEGLGWSDDQRPAPTQAFTPAAAKASDSFVPEGRPSDR